MGTNRTLLKRKRTILYKDCSELNIWNYIKALYKGELNYLVRSGPIPDKKILEAHLETITQEFNEGRGEKSEQIVRNDMVSYKEELEMKCAFGAALMNRLVIRLDQQLITPDMVDRFISELKKWGFVVNIEIPLEEAVEEIVSEIKAFRDTIAALHSQLFHEGEDDDEASDPESEVLSMLLSYRRILNIGKINPKKTSLKEFIAMEKAVKKIITEKNKTQ